MLPTSSKFLLLCLLTTLYFPTPACSQQTPTRQLAERPTENRYTDAVLLCSIDDDRIDESSGLAASTRVIDRFWTHNDSGDDARLFAFDTKGQHLGTVKFGGVEAIDWEDMASFRYKGRSYLLVADVGDNNRKRQQYQLHFVVEPVDPKHDYDRVDTIQFIYEDGPRNCEAMAVDAVNGLVLLAEKRLGLQSKIYSMRWDGFSTGNRPRVARHLATVQVGVITGMDISSDGKRLLIGTYVNAHEFTRQTGQTWRETLSQTRREITLPTLRQGEAICYGQDDASIYVTSEKTPCPFYKLSLAAHNER